jgi:CRP-like cAMP-binding protein
MKLQTKGRPVDQVYFIEAGVASLVSGSERQLEIALVGYEGMTGVGVVLGDGAPVSYEVRIRVEGRAQCLAAVELRKAINASSSLHNVLLLYVLSFVDQLAQTALANGRGTIEERLARWLLMVDDRTQGGALPLTHEALSVALGTPRPSVTIVLQELERRGLIARGRGAISIVDRKGLERCSSGAYLRPLSN